MRFRMGHAVVALAVAIGVSAGSLAFAQPKPFPRPGQPPPAPVPPPATQPPPAQPPATQPAVPQPPGSPTDTTLGLPIYPGAQFISSFDAGLGQRYYLFGTNTSFADIVSYYKTVLKEKGELVFDAPAIHMFEVGKFKEETMAFPPGVTVKDYTWNGSEGYLHVKGPSGTRFRTVIQIVPVPVGAIRN